MYTVRTARVKVCRGVLFVFGWVLTVQYTILTTKKYFFFNSGVFAVFEATVELAFFCALLYFGLDSGHSPAPATTAAGMQAGGKREKVQ